MQHWSWMKNGSFIFGIDFRQGPVIWMTADCWPIGIPGMQNQQGKLFDKSCTFAGCRRQRKDDDGSRSHYATPTRTTSTTGPPPPPRFAVDVRQQAQPQSKLRLAWVVLVWFRLYSGFLCLYISKCTLSYFSELEDSLVMSRFEWVIKIQTHS
jgi:hypothetical protein